MELGGLEPPASWVRFGEISPDLAERFRVEATPTLLVVHGKKVAARLTGPKSGAALTEFLSPWLQ